jgi:hypothetical protein
LLKAHKPTTTIAIESKKAATTGGTSERQTDSAMITDVVDAFLDSIAMPIQQSIIQEDYEMTQTLSANTSTKPSHLSDT